jgi:threonyl-tRNA synthetase
MSDLSENDHRRIGRDLKLFHVQEEAAGSVFWHANGWTLFRTIENYIRAKLDARGYFEVRTPQLFTRKLFQQSGHWDNYSDKMFCTGDLHSSYEDLYPEMADEQYSYGVSDATHAIKPMNCPAHVQIFNADNVSHKQLPMRMAEFGCCHRNEPSGSLHGIMRVRQFTQDDAHIFCTEDQIKSETAAFCRLLLGVYEDFGFTDVKIGFSTRPEVRAGDDATWDRAEAALAEAVEFCGLEYEVYPGEGAFYGPKLEFALKDSKGREWQCGTLQLDFVLPESLNARYMGEDGTHHRPVMLHRAILGSFERFIGILLEHYDGVLPKWLAPVQVAVVAIRQDSVGYAKEVAEKFKSLGLRVELDIRDENVSQKIKEHSNMAVPYIVAVGPRDEAARNVSVREFGSPQQRVVSLDQGMFEIGSACKTK